MKKLNFRTAIFVFLAILSAASYLYINSGTIQGTDNQEQSGQNLDGLSEEEIWDEDQDGRTPLPDVHLLKKMVEGGRRFIPAH